MENFHYYSSVGTNELDKIWEGKLSELRVLGYEYKDTYDELGDVYVRDGVGYAVRRSSHTESGRTIYEIVGVEINIEYV